MTTVVVILVATPVVMLVLDGVIGLAVSFTRDAVEKRDPAFARRWSGERGDALARVAAAVVLTVLAVAALRFSFVGASESEVGTMRGLAVCCALGAVAFLVAARRSAWRARYWE